MLTPERNNELKPCFVVLEPITPKVNVDFSSELKKVINERNILTTKTRKRVTQALEEIESETAEVTRKTKKGKLLQEIIGSEENYVGQLEVILEFFSKPVMERQLLKPWTFDILFGNIKSIYKINKELLEELRKGPENVTNAFSNIAPFFKCYSFYASGFKRSLEILQNCHREYPKFAKFLEMQETRPEVQSKLSALLIAPIQRVPRYKLLLKSLHHLTSPFEDDYDRLLDSLSKVEDAADHINKILKEQENMQRLIELQRCIQTGEPNIITPGRCLIKEGPLMRISSKDGHSKKMHIVLTNDIIMFYKMRKDELKVHSLKGSGIYPLGRCRVQELLDKGAFKVICQNEETVLYHESFNETLNWIEEIKMAIQILADDRKTLRKESTVRRPVKRKDLSEYNEIGLSPGKKLRKRKTQFEDTNNSISRPWELTKRKPLRTNFNDICETIPSPSFFVTLKPQQDNTECQDNKTNEVHRDVFVFGKPQPDRGFSFKMNQFFCGIGTSVKKFFGFK